MNDLLTPCCGGLGLGLDPSVMEPFSFENRPLFFGLFASVELWVMLPIRCLGAIAFRLFVLSVEIIGPVMGLVQFENCHRVGNLFTERGIARYCSFFQQ